ncbi:putative non-specific serine/threonine protein kinase [Helianthus annuus]|nr:putative non-specific serine/threonine protein kinase [Helianthus annuus]
MIGNRLTGSIPKELGNISTLTTLSVEDNLMSGTIPEELGNLASIERLYAFLNFFFVLLFDALCISSSYQLIYVCPIFNCRFLNSNSFSGTLPASFANLTTIKEFRIGGNNFSGKIPDYIGRWQSLKSLMQASGLEGPIPWRITLLANLSDLRISDLGGTAALCPPFVNTTSFKTLILRNCNLFGNLPESLPSSGLKVL